LAYPIGYAKHPTGASKAMIGAARAGLRWKQVLPPVRVIGALDQASRDACWELGATVAATL